MLPSKIHNNFGDLVYIPANSVLFNNESDGITFSHQLLKPDSAIYLGDCQPNFDLVKILYKGKKLFISQRNCYKLNAQNMNILIQTKGL